MHHRGQAVGERLRDGDVVAAKVSLKALAEDEPSDVGVDSIRTDEKITPLGAAVAHAYLYPVRREIKFHDLSAEADVGTVATSS